MTSADILLELREIQAPPEPPWWALSMGSMTLSTVLVAILLASIIFLRKRKSRRFFACARQDLYRIKRRFQDSNDEHELALALAKWLKQAALLAFPEHPLNGLIGSNWLVFLDRCIGDQSFTLGVGNLFGGAAYERQVSFDRHQVYALCDRWLDSIEPQLLRQGSRR